MMKKTILSVLVVATLGLAACVPTWDADNRSSAVKIVAGASQGSGVRVSDTEVITAAHVVGSETHVTVTSMGGDEFTAGVRHVDTTHDVAILVMPKTDSIRVAPLVCIRPTWGTPVTHQGYPLGFDHTWMKGYIMVDTFPKEAGVWPSGVVAFLPSAPGSSGGPVYDSFHRVVGTVVGGPRSQPSMTVLIPGERLCEVLEESRAVH